MLGAAATMAAQWSMGASWRVGVDEAERTDLVTTGAFALARNPIFTAMIATAIGLVAMVPNLIAVAGLALAVVAIELQVRAVEEPYLHRVHGERYRCYSASVGRFLPGIGRYRGLAWRLPVPEPRSAGTGAGDDSLRQDKVDLRGGVEVGRNFRMACTLSVLAAALAFLHALGVMSLDHSRAEAAASSAVTSSSAAPASGQACVVPQETQADGSLHHRDIVECRDDVARTSTEMSLPDHAATPIADCGPPPAGPSLRPRDVSRDEPSNGRRQAALQVFRC
ncbi:methyltransferase family protein [Actinoallomurus acanthiterrae]